MWQEVATVFSNALLVSQMYTCTFCDDKKNHHDTNLDAAA